MSERVFASAYHPCQVPCDSGDCSEYFSQMAAAKDPPCDFVPTFVDTSVGQTTSTHNLDPDIVVQSIDTGVGILNLPTM
jgi:hypothetical protein